MNEKSPDIYHRLTVENMQRQTGGCDLPMDAAGVDAAVVVGRRREVQMAVQYGTGSKRLNAVKRGKG